MKLSELLAEAGMKIWKDKEGCQTFHAQAKRCIRLLNDPNINDIDTKMVDKYIEELDTSLDKNRLINLQRQLYTEAQDLEI